MSGGIGESSLGSGSLTKIGGGTLSLESTGSYTGVTTVSAGKLQVDGTNSGSAVALGSGATLSGTGSVGAVTSTGGIIAPGDSGVGTLTVAGLSLDSATHLNEDVVSASSYDQIISSGSVALGNAILTPTLGGTTASTDRLEIVKNSPGTAINGTFNQLPENGLVTDGTSHSYKIAYDYNDGSTPNNVVLKGLNATTTTITSTAPAPTYGDTLTFTATVSAGVAGTPIQLWDGTVPTLPTLLKTSTIDASDHATFTYSSLTAGFHSIYVQFVGDGVYAPSQSVAQAFTVTQKALTVTGITAADKVYDGTTSATLNTSAQALSGVVSGDTVTLGGIAVGTFFTQNVGPGITVNVTGLTISGTSAANYSFPVSPATQGTTTASITAKLLTVTGITASNKVYDGGTTAMPNTSAAVLSGVVPGETVNLGGTPMGTFASKNVGTGITVNVNGLSISAGAGTLIGNYSFPVSTATQATTTANITPAPLTLVVGTGGIAVTSTKVYDGNTSASITVNALTLSPLPFGSDVVTPAGTPVGTYASKNVGTAINVQVSGVTVGGADVGNYTFTLPTLTASITAKGLTVTGLAASNKVYDGGTAATLTGTAALSGKVTGDDVTLGGTAVGTFASKNVANAIGVTITGLTIAGGDTGNYTFTQQTGLTANITAAPLTLTGITASNKVYDGGTTATLNTSAAALSGVVPGETVNLGGAAVGTFASKNVGTGITVNVNGLSISAGAGTLIGNYSFPVSTATQATTTANITPAPLTLVVGTGGIAVTSTKVYDGNTSASITVNALTLSPLPFGSDVVTPAGTPVGTYASKNVGTAINVQVSGVTVGGTDVGNYTFTLPTLTANITAKGLTVTGLGANDKVYDGTTTATINTSGANLIGVLGSDHVTVDASTAVGNFAVSKDAGTNKTVNITGLGLAGTDAGNYSLPTLAVTTADITAKALTVTGFAANNKVYDATTAATLTTTLPTLVGMVSGDTVTLTGPTGQTFASKNVGTGITVNVAGLGLAGSQASDYTVTPPTLTANITPLALTVTGLTASAKVYDGGTTATLTGTGALVGNLDGTGVTLGGTAAGTFASKNVNTGITVQVSGLTIAGAAAGNYTLTQPTTTANITTASLTATGITANDKVYDGTATATINSSGANLIGVIGSDVVSLNTATATGAFPNKNIGLNQTVTINNLSSRSPV